MANSESVVVVISSKLDQAAQTTVTQIWKKIYLAIVRAAFTEGLLLDTHGSKCFIRTTHLTKKE